jgi:hypothetical protein
MKIHTAFLTAALALALNGFALAGPKTYQATGPVTALTDSLITITKGKETWEIARDSNTKVTGDLKVGSKVTIEYTMTAATVEVKSADGGKGGKGGDKKKGDKK